MSTNEHLSTGEAARILNISRSTVSRRFDAGLLDGKLNPITGERLISRKSIEDTIRKHNLPVNIPFSGLKHVLVGSADQGTRTLIEQLFSEEHRVELDFAAQGSDTLIACSRHMPDLLVIDDHLPDLRGAHVIKSLRKHVDMEQMKILYCGRGLNCKPETAASWGADACIDIDKNGDESSLQQTIHELLGLPAESTALKGTHEHKRRWPRFPVNLDATLAIFPTARPDEQVMGKARINNISRGGAYLTDIFMEKATFPGEPFRLSLSVDKEPLQKWNAECQVMRLRSNGSLSAGVEFERITTENRRKISELQKAG